MENEKEIQEIKERLLSVESQLKHKSQFTGFLKIVLICIIVLVLSLVVIGVVQFVSAG